MVTFNTFFSLTPNGSKANLTTCIHIHKMKIPEHAVDDANEVTRLFLDYVIKLLDTKYGATYAMKNPHLVASLVSSSAHTFRTHIESGVYE